MNIYQFTESSLAELKTNIQLEKYKLKDEWVSSFFSGDTWRHPTRIYTADFELRKSEGNRHFDIENVRVLYTNLKDLTPVQASDERLWGYLAHVTFWEYMRSRWPVERTENREGVDPKSFVMSRYFFVTNKDRALMRNGISRLWWYGYITYDPSRSDPFELTEVLLSTQDVAQNIVERSFSRSKKVTKAILEVIADADEEERAEMLGREAFRELARYVNYLGGVSILDAFDEADLREIISSRLISRKQLA
jgi:hypothetical protein